MPTWHACAGVEKTAAPATAAGAASWRAPLPRWREHSAPGGACGVAYLSPLFLSVGLGVAGLAVDDRFEHSLRRAAEDDRRSWILHRMVGAPRQRDDRQIGALAGRQGTHLPVE